MSVWFFPLELSFTPSSPFNKILFSLQVERQPMCVFYRVNRRSQLLNERREILRRFQPVLEETKSRRRNALSHD